MLRNNLKILIIEDFKEDIELYRRYLTKVLGNLEIDEAHSASEGKEAIGEKTYDIILLDYNLPGINGIDFVKSIREMNLKLIPPIIALTGSGNEKVAVEFMKHGVCDYILKSEISLGNFSFAINKALESGYNKRIEHEKQIEQARFAHTVAHDLRSPLSRIEAYSRMLKKKNQDDIVSKYIQNIHEDSEYIIGFLDDLLKYAEYGRSNFAKETIDLNDIVMQSMRNLEIEIKKRHADIKTSSLPKIYGHATSLTQLFQNLISNAIKYCNKKPVIELSSEVKEHSAIIKITDNGIGIDKKKRKNIFEPFIRLENGLNRSGLGMGLALCKTIINQHMARIVINPGAQGGTEIKIEFPLA